MASVRLAVAVIVQSRPKSWEGHNCPELTRQVIEFANHFQKHSYLVVKQAKPLIDQVVLPA